MRDGYRVSWAAIAFVALAGLAVCALPMFELAVIASEDTLSGPRDRYFVRRPALVPDLLPASAIAVAAAAVVFVLAVVAFTSRRREVLAVPTAVIGLLLCFAVASTSGRLEWPSGGGAIGYDTERAGPLLGPAVDDLKAEARRTPEARSPFWFLVGGAHGFNGRALIGWRVLQGIVATIWLLAAYRASRLWLDPEPAVGATAGASFVVLAVIFFQSLSALE